MLQAFLDAAAGAGYGAQVVAVGSDRPGSRALARAADAGIPTFVTELGAFPDRESWDRELAAAIGRHDPDLVVCAGFMRILGPPVLAAFEGRIVNTHPALLPAFPGAHPVRDTLAYGVRVTGTTVHFVDGGVDTGPIVAQEAVPVLVGDTEEDLHARIKGVEQRLYVDAVSRLARGGWTVEGRTVLFR